MPKRAGRRSKAQTPAPPSERIVGSKKNPKGSAASEKSASKIKLDEKTLTALKNKLKEFKEEHPNKSNITLNDLKAVYRRGAGAYSKSHRPTITGGVPNSRNAWSMARVNKFLKKAGGEKVKAAYVQDDDLMEKGGEVGGVKYQILKGNDKDQRIIRFEKGIYRGHQIDEHEVVFEKAWGRMGGQGWAYIYEFGFTHPTIKEAVKNYLWKKTKGMAKGGHLENIDKVITCQNCGWSWKESQTTNEDKYICHKCGFDNQPYYRKEVFLKEGGRIGGFEDLEDEWLSKKIEIFLDKAKPFKFYYVDPKTNSLIVGFDEYVTQEHLEKVYREATSSKEYFHGNTVEATFNKETGDTIFKIKLRKVVEYANGGELNETFEERYGKDKFIELDRKDLDDFADTLLELIRNAYSHIGGHHEFGDVDEFKKTELNFWIGVDLDDDPNADVLIGGKKSPLGTKITVGGQDGSRASKVALIKKMKDLLKVKGYYTEMDEELARKIGVTPIKNQRTIKRIINKEDLEYIGDGVYSRNVGNSRKEKVLVGIPNKSYAKGGEVQIPQSDYLRNITYNILSIYSKDDAIEFRADFGEDGGITWEIPAHVVEQGLANEPDYIIVQSIDRSSSKVVTKEGSKGEGTKAIASLFNMYPSLKEIGYDDYSQFDDGGSFWEKIGGSEDILTREKFFQYYESKNYAKGGELDEKVIKERWAKKKDSLMNMADNIRSLRTNLRKDLKSENDKDRLTALAISIMDKTAERVGNDDSEANGHLGITGLSKRNVKVEGNTITLKYIGKSGVKHEKHFSDELIANTLKDAIANSQSKYVFETSDGFRIKNDRVNRYLSEYDISAKDLRGHSANQWIVSKLREVKDKEILGDEAKRKKKFNEIVKSVAEKVGHGAPTLKKHYMLPSLEREWVNHGKIVDLSNIKRTFKRGGDVGVANINQGSSVVNNIDYDHLDESQDIPNDGEGVFKKGGEIKFNDVIIYHEEKGNWFVPKNTIYAWLYDDPSAGEKLNSGDYDYVLFPPGGRMFGQKGYVPPLLKIWRKSYQDKVKGSDKLIGIVKAWYDEENKKLYVEMMTTKKDWRRKGVNSHIIKELREMFNLEKEQVVFDKPTKEGEKFMASGKYAKGGITEKEKYINQYLKKLGLDKENTLGRIKRYHTKYASKQYEKERLNELPYKEYKIWFQIPAGARYTTKIKARTPNEARVEFRKRNGRDIQGNTNKILSVTLVKEKKLASGGELSDENKKEIYKKWKSLINMSKSELEKFYNSEEGKVAGLTPQQAKNAGIDSGRESARWIMKMKDTKVSEWTPTMWKWAKKQISFVSRMSGNKGPLEDEKGNKTRKHTSLLIWGHNPKKKNNGGEIENTIKHNDMDEIKYSQLPAIYEVPVGKKFILKEHTYKPSGGKPQYVGCRYMVVENLGDSKMMDCLNLKVHETYGGGGLMPSSIITRPIKNIMNKGRDMGESLVGGVEATFKKGGELDPDKKEVKEYFEHKSGNAGGLLVGKRHSEGGIQATNKSTGTPLEMEGGEVVITRDAVSDSTLHEFDGKQMTNREILSSINESGGGVSFADGGDVSCKCSGKEYKYGGKTYKDYDLLKKINNGYGSKKAIEKGMKVEDKEHGETFKMLKNGEITYEQFLKKLVADHLSENPTYYDK